MGYFTKLFCQEEFLRRLSFSKYVDNLVLKGGMFIYTLTNFESRATIDIDFLLRQLPSKISKMQKIIDEILSIDICMHKSQFSGEFLLVS